MHILPPYSHPQCPSQCSPVGSQSPSTKLPRNVPPRIDIKYPTFIVMTANILSSTSQQTKTGWKIAKYSQQIADSSKHSIQASPQQCLIDIPRPSLLSQQSDFSSGGLKVLPQDTGFSLVLPPHEQDIEVRSYGHNSTEDRRKHDQEDAGRDILARCRRRPGLGIERRHCRCEEGHHHVLHAHVHVAGGVH